MDVGEEEEKGLEDGRGAGRRGRVFCTKMIK